MRARANAGEHLTGSVPYGYKRHETEKGVWVIDEEAAEVVREIFKLFIGGMNFSEIAREMCNRGIDTPSKHMLKYGLYKYGRRIMLGKNDPPDIWHNHSVMMIIDRYEYAGHTVSYRREKVSYKTKKSVQVPEEDWIITRDTQDAIIDEETFQTAKRMRDNGRRRKKVVHDKGPLNGLIFCPDCGSKLYFKPTPRLKEANGAFMCGYHLHYKAQAFCSTHYVRRADLEQAVLADLHRVTAFARNHEAEFVRLVERKNQRSSEDTVKKCERELNESQTRLNDIDRIINRLYEDKVSGELSAERFAKMLDGFETEQSTLRERCEELRVTLAEDRSNTENAKRFIATVKRFTEIPELTVEIANTLIQKVLVYQAEKVDGVQKQKIRVIYNFIEDVGSEIE
jgi:hypothetical protein